MTPPKTPLIVGMTARTTSVVVTYQLDTDAVIADRMSRAFRPDAAQVTWRDGEITEIELRGQLLDRPETQPGMTVIWLDGDRVARARKQPALWPLVVAIAGRAEADLKVLTDPAEA